MKNKDIELPSKGLGAREVTLEITSYCNLGCIHCYGRFGKETSDQDKVSKDDWTRILKEAREIGTTNLQISGGEPITVPYFANLIRYAKELDFPKVKVYTNATNISDENLESIKETDTLVRVTFFSYDPEKHDKITTVEGSHEKTSANIKKMYNQGVRLRAGVVLTPVNDGEGELEKTIEYLNELGIPEVRHDNVHGVGRARDFLVQNEYEALCGKCWMGKLAIDSQGYVHPCVMSRFITLGNVLEQGLGEILSNPELMKFRKKIYQDFRPKQS